MGIWEVFEGMHVWGLRLFVAWLLGQAYFQHQPCGKAIQGRGRVSWSGGAEPLA